MIGDMKELKKQIQRSWIPFFSRFGRLTDIQIKTIPAVLAGNNVVVASPTASGKTEAVVAPLAELLCREGIPPKKILVIYISPTRALANDMYERIGGPLVEMGFSIDFKHGDKSTLNTKNIPNFLITTPESLDSILCRHSSILSEVRAVILDEIHLLDNTYRGDQLRVLIRRLKKTSANEIAVHLISATLSDPKELAQRYVSSFDIVESKDNQRPINYKILGSLIEIQKLIREKRYHKVLYFCNLPRTVEQVYHELERIWKPYTVVMHHGGLERNRRNEAESVMKEKDVAACVATSTLEIGIDIGNIDLVVLVDVPWTVSALLQRVGRGKRRESTIYAVALATTEQEHTEYDEMFNLANCGLISDSEYIPDLSVVVQQAFSFWFQNKNGFTEQEFVDIVDGLCDGNTVKFILNHLVSLGLLDKVQGRYFITSEIADMAEKGEIHSNIPTFSKPFIIVDAEAGVELGKVYDPFDERIFLDHNAWTVESIKGNTVKVSKKEAHFSRKITARYRNQGEFSRFLPPDLKNYRKANDFANSTAKKEDNSKKPGLGDSPLQDLLQVVNPEYHWIIHWCHDNNLTQPVIGFELANDRGAVVGMCEMAWPEQHIGGFTTEQRDYIDYFIKTGWRCYLLDECPQDQLKQHLQTVLRSHSHA